MWILFPPAEEKALYPTRIPYEESSVFSNVNPLVPNLEKFPLFKVKICYFSLMSCSQWINNQLHTLSAEC